MKNKTAVPAHYRQGDVMIERMAALPTGLTKIERENGRVILAHGEVTGHAHTFAEPGVEKFKDQAGAEFFQVKGRHVKFVLPGIRIWKGQVMVNHPELGIVEFSVGDVELKKGHVHADGDFALLKHDEHHAQGIPAGFYKGARTDTGTVRQREYSPEAIRDARD